MENDEAKINWEMIRVVAQYLIYPIVVALCYLVLQLGALDRRLSTIEIVTSRPSVDIESIRKIAIIEDRQNRNIAGLEEIRTELIKHREFSEIKRIRQ